MIISMGNESSESRASNPGKSSWKKYHYQDQYLKNAWIGAKQGEGREGHSRQPEWHFRSLSNPGCIGVWPSCSSGLLWFVLVINNYQVTFKKYPHFKCYVVSLTSGRTWTKNMKRQMVISFYSPTPHPLLSAAKEIYATMQKCSGRIIWQNNEWQPN